MTTAVPESQTTSITREDDSHSTSATTSQGYVLPEGKIMPNTVFVGGIDIRMDEIEIRDFFARFGAVKEVKIITDRTGVSKGYGFVSYYDDVDVQKIVESQINFHGKKLKLGPAIRKQQNLCAYHVQPRPVILHPPAPQFHNVWNNQNTEPYIQYPPMVSPVTQYVQAYPPYQNSHPVIIQQIPLGYQQPAYNYQPYTTVNYHCSEMDPSGTEVLQSECSVHESSQPSSGNSPQKKSVDRSIQTVVSCLFNPENRLQRNSFVAQDDYLKKYRQAFGAVKNCKTAIFDMQCFTQLNCVLRPKEKRVHQFRRSKAVFKTVPN
ncbi:deleted in azoospermia-like isoform X2 [Rhinatrema bivittatum]|uniref:deleted in azoospermia-like isoform X2 n=1 Tax=Rhinatrema bivittatum TaxID=194408 RepID=UPI00112CEA74|nr:deleted in azoospermia-like isoform X2 [Rhinatrema bivittatum]